MLGLSGPVRTVTDTTTLTFVSRSPPSIGVSPVSGICHRVSWAPSSSSLTFSRLVSSVVPIKEHEVGFSTGPDIPLTFPSLGPVSLGRTCPSLCIQVLHSRDKITIFLNTSTGPTFGLCTSCHPTSRSTRTRGRVPTVSRPSIVFATTTTKGP